MAELSFFLILSVGGVFGAAVLNKRFEEMLPLSCCLIGLTVFLFGIAGFLTVSPAIIAVFAACMLVFSVCSAVRKQTVSLFLSNLFTPGFVGFLLVYVLLCLMNCGRLIGGNDPFGHWALAVKEMLIFGEVSPAHTADLYQNYPPIMPLFQYFLQMLLRFFGSTAISEWHLFFSFQIFTLSFGFPVLKYASWKRPLSAFFVLAVLCLAPMVVFDYYYNTVLIDSFLGMALAYGLYMVASGNLNSRTDRFSLLCTISVLVLAKDSGALFAIFLLAAVFLLSTEAGKRNWKLLLTAAAFLLVPKLLWSLHVTLSHCTVAHSGYADLGDYIRFFTLRDTSGYRYPALILFIKLQYGVAYYFQLGSLKMSYLAAFTGLLALTAAESAFLKKSGTLKTSRFWHLPALFAAFIVVYGVGLCYVYLFRMPSWDADGISEMDRYYNTLILPLFYCPVLLLSQALLEAKARTRAVIAAVMALFLLLTLPTEALMQAITRDSVRSSQRKRRSYAAIAEATQSLLTSPDQTVYIISQTDVTFSHGDIRTLRYLLVPVTSDYVSLGDSDWGGDFETNLSCAELLEQTRQHDLVIIYQLNDYFRDHYVEAFASPEEMHSSAVYRPDPQTGVLHLAVDIQ